MFTKEDIKNIATNAQINVTDTEAQKYAEDLDDMFAFINMINETEFICPEFTGFDGPSDCFKNDSIQKFETDCCSNSDNYKDSFFEINEKD